MGLEWAPSSVTAGPLSPHPPRPSRTVVPWRAARSQALGSVENRAPPSPFHAGALATAARGRRSDPARGPASQIRADLGRGGRRGRGPAVGAGTRRAALKRQGRRAGGLRAPRSDLGRWRRGTKARHKGAAARRGTKGAAKCSRHCAGPTKHRPRPPPPGQTPGAPPRAGLQLLHICPEAGRAPRPARSPIPQSSSRAGSGAICLLITVLPP